MREVMPIPALTLENFLFMQKPRMSNHRAHFCVWILKNYPTIKDCEAVASQWIKTHNPVSG